MEAIQAWLGRGSPETPDGYQDARRAEAKPGFIGEVWEGHGGGLFVGLMEALLNHSATEERRGGLAIQAVFSHGREMLIWTEDIVGWLKEHFEEVLNLSNTSFWDERELEYSTEDLPISVAEFSDVDKNILGGKAPCSDKCHFSFTMKAAI